MAPTSSKTTASTTPAKDNPPAEPDKDTEPEPRKVVKPTSEELKPGTAVAYGGGVGLALVSRHYGGGEVDLLLLEPGEVVRGVAGVTVYDTAADAQDATGEGVRAAHLH